MFDEETQSFKTMRVMFFIGYYLVREHLTNLQELLFNSLREDRSLHYD